MNRISGRTSLSCPRTSGNSSTSPRLEQNERTTLEPKALPGKLYRETYGTLSNDSTELLRQGQRSRIGSRHTDIRLSACLPLSARHALLPPNVSSLPAGRADARQVEAACRPVRLSAGLGGMVENPLVCRTVAIQLRSLRQNRLHSIHRHSGKRSYGDEPPMKPVKKRRGEPNEAMRTPHPPIIQSPRRRAAAPTAGS